MDEKSRSAAAIDIGEVVLNLGSGEGLDCFMASHAVGMGGSVIGVDASPEMVRRARDNARKAGCENVEFLLGEIERLPVADEAVDVVICGGVINLSPDKQAVFSETFRVLKPGGRLAMSDVMATATMVHELEAMLKSTGFADVRVEPREGSRMIIARKPGA